MNIQFENSFFEGEWREGFFVESEMKAAWAAEMKVLAEIDKVCRKHAIEYFVYAGTLLGAVRHKGFIPWDDDIDIAMKREDYMKFMSIASKELPASFFVNSIYENSEYINPFACVINHEYIDFSKEHLEQWYGCPWMVGVDVFPMDYLPEDEEEKDTLLIIINIIRYTYTEICKRQTEGEELDEEISLGLDKIEELCNVKIKRDKTVSHQLAEMIDNLALSYRNESSDEMAVLFYAANNRRKIRKKEWYEKRIYLPFENIEVPVPYKYEQVLTSEYGDWKTPVRGTALHEYPFYKKQRKAWEEYVKKQK